MRPLTLVCLLISTSFLGAQFDVDGPNASLTLQGRTPTVNDPFAHDVFVNMPGSLSLRVFSGANPNQALTLLASTTNPTTGNVIPTPWGGGIDLGTPGPGLPTDIAVFGDGIGLSTNLVWDVLFVTDAGVGGATPEFSFDAGLHPAWLGAQAAFQAVVQDPTMPPFLLDNTDTASGHFVSGQSTLAMTGNDGSQQVAFLPGFSFDFHGLTYTDVWVQANGFVTFGAPTSLVNAGFDNDNVAAVNAEPAIFAGMNDWDPTALNAMDGIVVEQLSTQLRVEWGDPVATQGGGIAHAGGADLNDFAVRLELDDGQGGNPQAGSFRVDMFSLDPTTASGFGEGLVGHTPGGLSITGGAADRLLRAGTDTSAPGEAQVEEHDLGGLSASRLGWDAAGSPRGYNDYTIAWNQAAVIFSPNAAGGPAGSGGYTSTSVGPLPPDAFQGFDLGAVALGGGQVLTLTGSFLGFDPNGTGAGTVVFDPTGAHGGPYPATVVGILDDTGVSGPLSLANTPPGPHRNGQGLQILTPSLGGFGTYTVQVNFASGMTKCQGIMGTPGGAVITSFALGDDSSMLVNLSVPVTLYGQTFTSLFMNSNGYVTFAQGSPFFSESFPLFFDGNVTGVANPMVALWFSDLNNGGLTSGATYDVIEDSMTGTVTCAFNNQNHWASGAPAGNFSCTFDPFLFGPGSVTLDYTSFLAGPNSTDNGIIGVSDGDVSTTALGTDTNLTNGAGTGIASVQGTYISPGPNDSIGEQIPSGIVPTFASNPLVFFDLGGGQFLIL
ncbi:MAG TPA: hypothetical protein ENK43_01665 [Planctomycetes bacterium]|nr:hypothetical protein [Planctomycetota bacterium]